MVKKTAVMVVGLILLMALVVVILLLALRDRSLGGEGVTFLQRAARFCG